MITPTMTMARMVNASIYEQVWEIWPTPTLLLHSQHIYLGSSYSRHTSTNGLDSELPPVMEQMGWLAISSPLHYIHVLLQTNREFDCLRFLVRDHQTNNNKTRYHYLLNLNIFSWLHSVPLVWSKYIHTTTLYNYGNCELWLVQGKTCMACGGWHSKLLSPKEYTIHVPRENSKLWKD